MKTSTFEIIVYWCICICMHVYILCMWALNTVLCKHAAYKTHISSHTLHLCSVHLYRGVKLGKIILPVRAIEKLKNSSIYFISSAKLYSALLVCVLSSFINSFFFFIFFLKYLFVKQTEHFWGNVRVCRRYSSDAFLCFSSKKETK